MKPVALTALGVAVAFGVGWLTGVSGRSSAEVTAGRALEQAAFLEARSLVLEGRVNLFQGNFGDARLRFDEARNAIERLQSRLRETGLAERAGLLEVALSYLRRAADQAAAFDAGAQSAADAALQTLERVQ